jgi:hypothetical protein
MRSRVQATVKLGAAGPAALGGRPLPAAPSQSTARRLRPHHARPPATGTELLSAAVKLAAADPAVAAAQLHVQTSNADAIAFYQRRGFQLGGVLCNYYRRLSPPDAVELYRALHAGYRHGPPASKAAGGEATPGGSASLGSSVRQQTHQHVQPG